MIGQPEISTDGFHPYKLAIRNVFGDSASHGVIVKTYSVTHLVKEAQGRYSPAAVVKVDREVVSGDPDQYVSTSYVERGNLSLRMASRRFTRLTNGFSKKLDNHVAAVALYVAHCNLCRVHETLRTTPAKALGIAERPWTISQLVDAALNIAPALPTETPPGSLPQVRSNSRREIVTHPLDSQSKCHQNTRMGCQSWRLLDGKKRAHYPAEERRGHKGKRRSEEGRSNLRSLYGRPLRS